MLILQHYRAAFEDVFADYPQADFEREVRAVLAGCESSFQAELNERERLAYLALPELERPAFRIARSLALCESNAEMPPPLFFLGNDELQGRIGGTSPGAWRILQWLEKRAIIEKVKPGTKHTKGARGLATVWRWLLASDEAQ